MTTAARRPRALGARDDATGGRDVALRCAEGVDRAVLTVNRAPQIPHDAVVGVDGAESLEASPATG